MYRTRLRAVGGSVMFAIPKAILESLDLEADASVGLSIANGKLIVDPRPLPRYSLAELVTACDVSAPATAEDVDWLGDRSVGHEAIQWIAATSTLSTSTRFGGMNRSVPGMF